jgi:hypothetical protein
MKTNQKPIIFSGEMVLAILAGKKTMTRRRLLPKQRKSDCNIKLPYQIGDVLWVKENYRKSQKIKEWKSPLFMPKSAARIWLKVTDVRIERLQDISPADARAEGFITRSDFKIYWNSLYANKPEKQWDANPYVCVVEFQRIEKPEGGDNE